MASYEAYLGVGIDASGAQAGATQVDNALKKVSEGANKSSRAIKSMQSQLQQAQNAMKMQQRQIGELSNSLETHRVALGQARKAVELKQRQIDIIKQTMMEYSNSLKEANQSIRAQATDIEKLKKALEDKNSALERSKEELEKYKQQIGSAALAVKVFAAAAAALAVREIANYTQSLSNARAMTNATAEDMARLEVVTRELGASTVFSAAQVADAAAELGKAGFSVNNIIEALPATLDLAAAASIGIAQAADITAGVMAGFGIAAKDSADAADILAVVATGAKTDISGLGEAIKYVGPVAKSVGWTLSETSAILGVLANQGIEGSMAGTSLKSTISSLVSPTKTAAAALQSLGLSVEDVRPGLVKSDEIFRRLAAAGIDAERAFQIFGERGAVGVLAVTSALENLDKMTGVIQNHEGAARRMAEIKLDNIAGDWEKLTGELSETAMVLGSAGLSGALRDLIQTGTQWVEWLNKMVECVIKNKEQAALLNDVLIAVGSTIAGIIVLKAALWFSGLAAAIAAATTAVAAFNAAVLLIGGATLGALGYLFKMRMEIIELEKYTRKQENALLDMAGATGEAARQAEIATLQMRRAQMRTADEIVADIANIQGELAGIGQGYLLQNQAMLDQKRIKEGQLSQLQKELSIVEELKKKEDELVVKKITTSRAYQQNAELARQTGLAAMGMMTGNVTQAPTVPGAPPVTPIATSGGSASASKSSDARSQSKAQYSVDGMMSAAFNQMGILKQEADKIISTFKQQEEAKQKYIDGVKKQTEAEQKRLELTKIYGDNMSEIDTQMQLYNATREYGIQIGSEEYRQLEEQIRARKQAADSVKELEKAKANEVEQAKKAAESQKQWNNQLTYAFKDAIMNSKNLGDALSNLANRVQDMLVNKALDSLLGGMFASMKFAKGAAFSAGGVTAFASGGVVNSPTMFPMRGGVGLMGEAGAEAIMPLTRTSNGDLGVKAVGTGGVVIAPQITVNVSGGTREQNEDAGKRVSAAVRQAIDDTVVSVIMREKRPGGVLNAA